MVQPYDNFRDALNSCVDNKMNEKDALECIYQVSKGVK